MEFQLKCSEAFNKLWFENCKMIYGWGLWKNSDLQKFVAIGQLTPDQYKEITGEEYVQATAQN